MESKNPFFLYEKVWGKVKGWPHWPCFIKHIDYNKGGEPKYTLHFFGDNTIGYLKRDSVVKFEEGIEKGFADNKKKAFQTAYALSKTFDSSEYDLPYDEIPVEQTNDLFNESNVLELSTNTKKSKKKSTKKKAAKVVAPVETVDVPAKEVVEVPEQIRSGHMVVGIDRKQDDDNSVKQVKLSAKKPKKKTHKGKGKSKTLEKEIKENAEVIAIPSGIDVPNLPPLETYENEQQPVKLLGNKRSSNLKSKSSSKKGKSKKGITKSIKQTVPKDELEFGEPYLDKKDSLLMKITQFLSSILSDFSEKTLKEEKALLLDILDQLKVHKLKQPVEFLRKYGLGNMLKKLQKDCTDNEVSMKLDQAARNLEEQVVTVLFPASK